MAGGADMRFFSMSALSRETQARRVDSRTSRGPKTQVHGWRIHRGVCDVYDGAVRTPPHHPLIP